MKNRSTILLTASLAGVMITPSLAIESPEDDAPPPPAVELPLEGGAKAIQPPRFDPPAAALQAPEAEATAFLGVVTSDLPEMLADHLNLNAGEGIIVRSLMPDGPAAKAGISPNDVILRVGDQPIHSPKNLSDCITGQKPGDIVNVDLIQKGKPVKLDITLGTRPAAVAAAQPMGIDDFGLEQLPEELADRIREAIEGNLGALDLRQLGGDDDAQVPEQMEEAMRDLRNQLQGALLQPNGLNAGQVDIKSGATLRMKDPEGCVEIKANSGSKEISVTDQQGKEIWAGPWDTEQDKAAAPEDVRRRIESLNLDMTFKGAGLRLNMRQPAAPLDDD